MHWNVALWSLGLWVILSLAAGQLTEQGKSTIIDLHNELRSKVQPRAAFMQKVVRDAPDWRNTTHSALDFWCKLDWYMSY